MGASITIDCYANRVNTLAMDTLQTRCHTGQPRSSADTDQSFTQALTALALLSSCYIVVLILSILVWQVCLKSTVNQRNLMHRKTIFSNVNGCIHKHRSTRIDISSITSIIACWLLLISCFSVILTYNQQLLFVLVVILAEECTVSIHWYGAGK